MRALDLGTLVPRFTPAPRFGTIAIREGLVPCHRHAAIFAVFETKMLALAALMVKRRILGCSEYKCTMQARISGHIDGSGRIEPAHCSGYSTRNSRLGARTMVHVKRRRLQPSFDTQQRQAYQRRLTQEPYQFEMRFDGHTGGHTGWVVPTFIARHVAPLIGTTAEQRHASPAAPMKFAAAPRRRSGGYE